jgi:hypothetical protein
MKSVVRLAVVVFVAGTALAMVAIPAVLPVIPYGQSSGPAPSDDAMIAHWQDKRPVFEELAAMLKDDPSLKRLALDWSDPAEPGVAPERLARYRALMRQAGIISLHNFGKEMEFLFHASGLSVSGAGKSFVLGEPPAYAEQVSGDLAQAATGQSKGTWQRRIEGRWRLQLDKS